MWHLIQAAQGRCETEDCCSLKDVARVIVFLHLFFFFSFLSPAFLFFVIPLFLKGELKYL